MLCYFNRIEKTTHTQATIFGKIYKLFSELKWANDADGDDDDNDDERGMTSKSKIIFYSTNPVFIIIQRYVIYFLSAVINIKTKLIKFLNENRGYYKYLHYTHIK